MLTRFSKASEFFGYIQENESNEGFMAQLATELGVSEDRLNAAFVAHQATGSPSSLINLFGFYQDWQRRADRPSLEEMLGDAEDINDLPRLQQSRIRQLHREPDPEVVTLDMLIEDYLRVLNEKDDEGWGANRWISEELYGSKGRYSLTAMRSVVGNIQELHRQAGIKLTRGQQKMQSAIAYHTSLDVYSNFYQKDVLPYANQYPLDEGKGGRWKHILVGSDFHDMDADPFVLGTFLDTAKDMQPEVILLNGDIFDLYEFSRYDKDPRGILIKDRFDFVHSHIFGALRKACPNAQIDFVIGNHDWRLLKVMADATPELKVLLHEVMGLTLADVFGVHRHGINLHTKQNLNFRANNKTEVNKQLKQNYKTYYDRLYVAAHIKDYGFGVAGTSGHTHKPRLTTKNSLAVGQLSWMTTGSICRLDAPYVEGFDHSQNSFGIVYLDTHKRTVQQQPVVFQSDSVVVNGKRYERSQFENEVGNILLPAHMVA